MARRYWMLVVFVGAALFSPRNELATAAAGAEVHGRDWSSLEARLKSAMLRKQFDLAKSLVSELADTGELMGYQLIIKYAMRGQSYDLDRHAGALLAQVVEPRIRKEVYSTLRDDRNLSTRIILVAVVARWADDPAALDALSVVLTSVRTRKELKFAVLYWIRKIGRPEKFVEPLIAELERRERKPHDRVYADLRRTLKTLTGRDFDVAIDWKNYWKARQQGLPAPPKPSGEGRTVLANKASFFSVAVDSDRVLFVIDVSSSMEVPDTIVEEPPEPDEESSPRGKTVVKSPDSSKEGPRAPRTVTRRRITRVKEELIHTIQTLPPHVRFGVMSFSHEIAYLDKNILAFATNANKARAIQWVRALRPNGATRTDLALQEALLIPEVDTLYVLTDGAPKDVNNQKIPPEQVYSVVKTLNRFRKCRINTIGFSQAGHSMRLFVQHLAQTNDGKCVLLK